MPHCRNLARTARGLSTLYSSIYDRITAHRYGTVAMPGPRDVTALAQDLCNELLHPDVERRPALDEKLKRLKFFNDLPWEAISAGTATSPLADIAAAQVRGHVIMARSRGSGRRSLGRRSLCSFRCCILLFHSPNRTPADVFARAG